MSTALWHFAAAYSTSLRRSTRERFLACIIGHIFDFREVAYPRLEKGISRVFLRCIVLRLRCIFLGYQNVSFMSLEDGWFNSETRCDLCFVNS